MKITDFLQFQKTRQFVSAFKMKKAISNEVITLILILFAIAAMVAIVVVAGRAIIR